MLISVKDINFTSIGEKMTIRTIIQQHNSVLDYFSTEPLHIQPYALFAYICGSDSKTGILFYVEHLFKERRDRLIRNGANDAKA